MLKFLKENKYLYYKNYRLNKVTTIISNEKCKYFIIIKNYNELYRLIDFLNKKKVKYLIIGNGSKLVFINNYHGVIISLKELDKIRIDNNICEVEAGTLVIALINKLKRNNLGGIEKLVGIPSSIGGGLINNISAHNVALSDYLIKLYVYKDDEIKELSKREIIFSYRYSSLRDNCIVLKAIFKFDRKDKNQINEEINVYKNYRKENQEIVYPNIGSIFKNNIRAAALLIKEAKLENFKYKNVSFSKKHLNFINIKGKTKGKNIYRFTQKVIKKVKKRLNINLKTEINFIKS